MILTGQINLTAARHLPPGWRHESWPPDALLDEALNLAGMIAANSNMGVRMAKKPSTGCTRAGCPKVCCMNGDSSIRRWPPPARPNAVELSSTSANPASPAASRVSPAGGPEGWLQAALTWSPANWVRLSVA